MRNIVANTGRMQDTAGSLATETDSLDGLLNRFRIEIDQLHGYWQGKAKDDFFELFREQRPILNNATNAVRNFSVLLRTTAEEYESFDRYTRNRFMEHN